MSDLPDDRDRDSELDALLRQLRDQIGRETLPEEIRSLALQLEAALRRRLDGPSAE